MSLPGSSRDISRNVSKRLRKNKQTNTGSQDFRKNRSIKELEATYVITKMAWGFLFAKAEEQPVHCGLQKLDPDCALMIGSEDINAPQ